jgi:16S rRNA (guanine(966)-N(2))-methyltransferase RsmD
MATCWPPGKPPGNRLNRNTLPETAMRVISGTAKGRKLQSVPGDQTRPITDRVKEALFDIVGPDVINSRWWDLFAGTGAVGIEALSRGAAFALLTDLGRAPLETIKVNLARTGLAARAVVRRADAFASLAAEPERPFDYIYIAPPQYRQLWLRSLQELDANIGWLDSEGWVVVQIDPKEYAPLALANLHEFDTRRYGTTLLVFYSRAAG